MTIYIVQIFIICLSSMLIQPKLNKQRKRWFLFYCFLVLWIVASLRAYSVGADTSAYVGMFNHVERYLSHKSRYERGFLLLLYYLKRISPDPAIMLTVTSGIYTGAICYLVYKRSAEPFVSMILYILLGLYFSQMNTMRQALASSIGIMAFMVLIGRNSLKNKVLSALLILFAMCMHTVAIGLFIPYFAFIYCNREKRGTRFTAKQIIYYSLVISVCFFIGYFIVLKIVGVLFPSYLHYFSGEWSDSNYRASLAATMISLAFAGAGGMVFRDRELNEYQEFSALMTALSFLIGVMSMRMEIWSRVQGLFTIYAYLVWVPDWLSEIRMYKNRFIAETAVLLFSFAYMIIVLVYRPEWTRVAPYVFR